MECEPIDDFTRQVWADAQELYNFFSYEIDLGYVPNIRCYACEAKEHQENRAMDFITGLPTFD